MRYLLTNNQAPRYFSPAVRRYLGRGGGQQQQPSGIGGLPKLPTSRFKSRLASLSIPPPSISKSSRLVKHFATTSIRTDESKTAMEAIKQTFQRCKAQGRVSIAPQ